MHLIAAFIHTLPLLYMLWGFNALENFVPQAWIGEQRGGHFQFLTIQGLFLAKATVILCILSDLLPRNRALNQTRRAFLMIALPLSIVISSIYWTLMNIAPGLLVPADNSSSGEPTSQASLYRIPFPMDIALHLTPVLTLLAHFMLFEEVYNQRWQKLWAPVTAFSFAAYYASFQEWCASANGTFSYPFLSAPVTVRLAIYAAATLLAIGSFILVNKVHRGRPVAADLYRGSRRRTGSGLDTKIQ